jgi:hypothetical protein
MMRLCLLAACCAAQLFAAAEPPEIGEAFHRLYNFNFPAAHQVLDQYISGHAQEPLPYAVRASAYLFFELDRLGILEGEFFTDDNKIAAKKGLKPDPGIRAQFLKAIDDTRTRANAALAANPQDHNALFAMCITQGVTTDYMALVEKRQMKSLIPAKDSNRYAQQLLRIDPKFYDAYLTTGITEYMVGSLPFFVRWFVHFDNVQGNKEQGIRNLQVVARNGHYLRPFAKILLGIVYMREKKPQQTEQLLAELTQEYPANPLLRRELTKVQAMLAGDR